MFPEFGQAPLCLDIDLDSYEGSWTHVAKFRGGSGWLQVARATIQSENDLLRGDLIAACDEQGNAIPAWRAVHLTQCDWSRLEPCFDEPPAILDDLLCEEEGNFYAHWQREMNAELAKLFAISRRAIDAIEAQSALRQQSFEIQIADLNRRRRMPDCGIEAKIAISAVIADLEAAHDGIAADLIERRARLRREADEIEESLWQRTDVLIELEPLFTVRWRDANLPALHDVIELPPCKVLPRTSYIRDASAPEVWFQRLQDEEDARLEALKGKNLRKGLDEPQKGRNPTEKSVGADGRPVVCKLNIVPKLDQVGQETTRTSPRPVSASPHEPELVTGPQKPSGQSPTKAPPSSTARLVKLESQAERLRAELALPGSHPNWRAQKIAKLRRLERAIAEIGVGVEKHSAREDEKIAGIRSQSEDVLDTNVGQSNWSAGKIETLQILWRQGRPLHEISEALGGISRNVVIAKAHRLGLQPRAQSQLAQRQVRKQDVSD